MKKPDQFRLSASELKPLAAKRDLPAALRCLGHLGAIGLNGALLWSLLHTWWAVPLTLLQGYLIAFLFTAEHEMAHHTAFRTRVFNYAMGHLAGFAIMLPYEYYRAFHWDHHRYTNDPEKDPELLTAPQLNSRLGLLWYLIGLPIWAYRIRMLIAHCSCKHVTEPWVPENKRKLIALEARFYLFAYFVIIAASIAAQSLVALWLWVVPVMAGQFILRPYLLAEHTGCAQTPNMLENTRTTYTNAIIRYFAWNMPYHVEHHAYPVVPFHALPKLNRILAPHIVNTEQGYPASTAAAMTQLASEIRHASLVPTAKD